MKVISYILMTLFSVLLIVLIPLGAVGYSANSTIAKPYNTEKYLSQSGLYKDIKKVMRNNAVGVGDEDKAKQTTQQKLVTKMVGLAFDTIVTDHFISSKMSLLQTSFWDYMTDKTSTFLRVPIAELADISEKYPGIQLGKYADFNALIGLKAEKMENLKTSYKIYQKGVWVLYILIIALVIVCGLLTYTLNISGKWLGVSLVIGGVLTLLVWIPIILLSIGIQLPENMASYKGGISTIVEVTSRDFLKILTIIAVVVVILGIISIFIRKRAQTPPELPPEISQKNDEMLIIL